MKALFIDTTSNEKITIELTIDEKKDTITQPLERQKAQIILPLIEQLIEKHALTMKEIDVITVNPGPGSFTGVRVGVSIANALSYTLGIPVNKINVATEDKAVEPVY